jgi:hypothetical protein
MKTGFKATYNFMCRNHKFEIGKTYELQGIIVPCNYGFHYCINPIDVLEYYPIQHNFRLLEIEDLGTSVTDGNKTATNKLRVAREIPKEEYYSLFGIVNNQLTTTDEFGYWAKRTFDERNNRIRYENSHGYWTKFEYDERNNCIYYETSNRYWQKQTFDENNHRIDCESGYDKV